VLAPGAAHLKIGEVFFLRSLLSYTEEPLSRSPAPPLVDVMLEFFTIKRRREEKGTSEAYMR